MSETRKNCFVFFALNKQKEKFT